MRGSGAQGGDDHQFSSRDGAILVEEAGGVQGEDDNKLSFRDGALIMEEVCEAREEDGAQTVRDQDEGALQAEQHHDERPILRMWPPATGLVIHGPQVADKERTGGL